MRVRDFAEQVAKASGCKVLYKAPSELEQTGYSKVSRAVLDASRLETLGWQPEAEDAIGETVRILLELNGP